MARIASCVMRSDSSALPPTKVNCPILVAGVVAWAVWLLMARGLSHRSNCPISGGNGTVPIAAALSVRQSHPQFPSVPKSGSGSNVSCFVGHEHAEYCSYPFGSGMGCHRIGRESRSPVHVTCQQRSSSQIATTGSRWPVMRTRTGVFTGAVQIGLHPCSPELGPCELVCGKATPSCSGRPAAWMIG